MGNGGLQDSTGIATLGAASLVAASMFTVTKYADVPIGNPIFLFIVSGLCFLIASGIALLTHITSYKGDFWVYVFGVLVLIGLGGSGEIEEDL